MAELVADAGSLSEALGDAWAELCEADSCEDASWALGVMADVALAWMQASGFRRVAAGALLIEDGLEAATVRALEALEAKGYYVSRSVLDVALRAACGEGT